VAAEPWGIKRAAAAGEDGDGLLPVGPPVRRLGRRGAALLPAPIAELVDSASRSCWPASSTTCAGQRPARPRGMIFKLDDGSEAIEAVANEEALDAEQREWLREDELLVACRARCSPTASAGGLRLNVHAGLGPGRRARALRALLAWRSDLNAACPGGRAGARLAGARGWTANTVSACRACPCGCAAAPGACARGRSRRRGRIWPSDEALARWRAAARDGRAEVVYEAG
jgi:DNA polymerase-3 subunit alpha